MFSVRQYPKLSLKPSHLHKTQPLNPSSAVTFVSKTSVDNGTIKTYNLQKQIEPVKNCRTVTKHDMKFNNSTPAMEVDPELFVSTHTPPSSALPACDIHANKYLCRPSWQTG